jgi:hypothetical protein
MGSNMYTLRQVVCLMHAPLIEREGEGGRGRESEGGERRGRATERVEGRGREGGRRGGRKEWKGGREIRERRESERAR